MSTINCLIHPHHVNLLPHYTSIQTLHQHVEDPYYGLDRQTSHAGVSVPRFDIREADSAFYLDGEVPGLTDPKDIFIEWIEKKTLIVRGSIKPKVLEEEKVTGKSSPVLNCVFALS
jgi:HSP20 family molecular chaperone IbpA